jgi:hypothetical protein
MNKKLILSFALLVTCGIAWGQEYKPFKMGLGMGYAMPAGDGSKGGVLFYAEPAYRITDAFAIGLRLEAAVMGRGFASTTASSTTIDIAVSANASYTVNGQYYFSNNTFRPFAGFGFGVYSMASETIKGPTGSTTTDVIISGESKFGFYPRIGFDVSHFTMNLEYNIIPGTASGGTDIKNSYFGIKAGFFISGGKK